jgi:hypothetical protein
MRLAVLLLLTIASIPAVLHGRMFVDESQPARNLFEAPQRPASAGSFGLSWSIEVRACERPKAILWGFGFDGMLRLHDRLWLNLGASYLYGTSSEAEVDYEYQRPPVHGLELRGWAQYRFAQWRSNSSYIMAGPTLAYSSDEGRGRHMFRDTLSVGPSLFMGIELGRIVRAAFDGGVTIPFALNRGDAGWLETHVDSGDLGLHWTIVRFSLRWYSRGR